MVPWDKFHRACDALTALDAELGQIAGVGDQSALLTAAIRRFRTEAEQILQQANTAVRGARND